ncbi:MAG TPA: Uma2 family endonuclease [Cyclobacteriaceae bacterium]|jgi:Uma2 family endonuclease|nr:Uma2 family endonuclease [Cytophagales bacterium]HNT49655.1 Uma2 family endonuclease [Cyclobacteriaceae bacterium]HRE67501.1 Uma2 family endonuclease [Cyclobacteriaceae bacterium]HRF33392.1 Uma2 family endonuclease [Cyclobacteriaceae bacterium]
MKVEEPDLSLNYTYADYLKWDLPEMVELIRGKVFKMSPAPTSSHQRISGGLFGTIHQFLKTKKCEVFSAPFDVRLPRKGKADKDIVTVVQPDICVICDPQKIDERGCLGAPDWIIEILSKHTSAKDLNEKFDVYEESGVKEYWVVHPSDHTVLVYTLNEHGKYEGILKPYTRSDKVQPQTLPGLTIDLAEIFEEPEY